MKYTELSQPVSRKRARRRGNPLLRQQDETVVACGAGAQRGWVLAGYLGQADGAVDRAVQYLAAQARPDARRPAADAVDRDQEVVAEPSVMSRHGGGEV